MIDIPSTLLSLIQETTPKLPESPPSPFFWMPLDASVTVRSTSIGSTTSCYWMSVFSSVILSSARWATSA